MTPAAVKRRAGGSLRLRPGAGLLRHLEFPPEVLMNLPRLTLVGNLQLTLENHQGLERFGPGELCVATRSGKILIQGEDLVIGSVGPDEIRAAGRLLSLRFEPPREGG